MAQANATTQHRILRALASGPLFEGALGLILGWPSTMRRELRRLQEAGLIERDPNHDGLTWRLRDADS